MSQNRDAPAFQEYAAATLSRISFRLMPLQARGLLHTMRLECWVNKCLPSDPEKLAAVLGVPAQEVVRSLPLLDQYFEVQGDVLICPELEDYRQHITDRRRKQSEGGKEGAARTNKKRKQSGRGSTPDVASIPVSTLATIPRLPRRGEVESLVQSSTEKHSQNQSSVEDVDVPVDEWIKNYDEADNF